MFGKQRRNRQWLDILIFAVVLIVLYKLIDNLGVLADALKTMIGILQPFILGLVLAFLLYTPARLLESRFSKAKNKYISRFARGLSIGITYIVFFGVLALFVSFMVPVLGNSAANLVSSLPVYYQRLVNLYNETELKTLLSGFLDVEKYVSDLYSWALSLLTVENLTASINTLISVTSSLLNVVMSVVISVYMLSGRESLIAAIRRVFGLFIPEHRLVTVGNYVRKTGNIFSGYIYGMLIDACIMAVYATICLLILGIPNAPLFGVMMGVLNLIPYFGALIGGVICFLVALLSRNIYVAIGIAVLIGIGQQLDGNLIQPRILTQQVGVRAIYVLLAITVGGGLFGFWGIILGVPAIAVVQMLLRDILHYRNQKSKSQATVTATATATASTQTSENSPDKEGM